MLACQSGYASGQQSLCTNYGVRRKVNYKFVIALMHDWLKQRWTLGARSGQIKLDRGNSARTPCSPPHAWPRYDLCLVVAQLESQPASKRQRTNRRNSLWTLISNTLFKDHLNKLSTNSPVEPYHETRISSSEAQLLKVHESHHRISG